MFRSTRRRSKTKATGSRSMLIEPLENRQLLSASLSALVGHPLLTATPAITGSNSVVGFTPAQIRHAYGIDAIKFGSVVGDGTGQTIAIIDAFNDPKLVNSTDSSFASSDLHQFDQAFSLPDPPSFTKIDQSGGTSYPASNQPGWANEEALDVEWTHAIAPKANIILVEAFDDTGGNLIQAAVQHARQIPGVSAISMSFALTNPDNSEPSTETSLDSYFQTPLGHTGITFVAASGDKGSLGGYPAFSPNVLAVGGTILNLSGTSYVSESGSSTSGGAISKYEPKPVYQTTVNASSTQRTIPDVAFDGDMGTGVAVYDSNYNGPGSAPWYKVGGTSFSAPAWGALIAIANQGRATLGLGTMDGISQTLPRLYELPSTDFHDITSGSNGNSAKTGYDLVAGRGTPIANKLIPDLAGGGSISGTVFSDSDGDAIWDHNEYPVSGRSVFLDFNGTGALAANDIQVHTDSNGHFSFNDLPGNVTYKLVESTPAGWRLTTPHSFPLSETVGDAQAVSGIYIGTQQNGSISGHLFDDLNGDGIQDNNEPNLTGWAAFLDFYNSTTFQGADYRVYSDSSGNFTFVDLAVGNYRVVQNTPSGWQRTVPASVDTYNVAVKAGAATGGVLFGRKPNYGSISGNVFNDLNANGALNSGDSGLSGWGVFLDFNNTGVYASNDYRVTTDSSGNFSMTGLLPGRYRLVNTVPSGWLDTAPSGGSYYIDLSAGQKLTGQNFGAYQPASISGTVFHDANRDRLYDPGDNGLNNWSVFLDFNNTGVYASNDYRVFTDTNGHYSLIGLLPGRYRVVDTLQSGYTQSTPSGGSFYITVTSGQNLSGQDFGAY